MPSQDQDSEYDSEDQELEFQLYQQLYFEPNPDADEANNKSISSTQEHHGVTSAVIGDGQHVQDCAFQMSQILESEHDRSRSLYSSPSKTLINENKSRQIVHSSNKEILENCEPRTSNHMVEYSTDIAQLVVKNTQVINGISEPAGSVKNGVHLIDRNSLHSVRERLSSTCSDGSIPGSIPLDSLYCNVLSSDDEEVINNTVIMKAINMNDPASYKETSEAKSSERKRRHSYSEDEAGGDSRCDNLINVARKSAVEKHIIYQVEDDSNSEEELYVIPTPKPSQPEILTLESSSEDESKQNNKEENRVKTRPNKYLKIDQPVSSTQRTEKENSEEIRNALKRKKNQEQFESITITSESESDTNDICLPEATKGTDLTLNIDKSLTGWVKTITKNSNSRKKKGNLSKIHKKNRYSSVDFTKGRPVTARTPSCEKWTQGMAAFYDSDVSEEFDVSEIHFQQSDSSSMWHLDGEDLQIIQRRRYYNAPLRCKRCREEGHSVESCPRVPVCRFCSRSGHVARKDCPENCCFKCGGDPHYYCRDTNTPWGCSMCGLPGHFKQICPDLWRQFHITTSGNFAQVPTEDYTRPPAERYCYTCGKRGHYGHQCPHTSQIRSYTLVPQSVSTYNYSMKDRGYTINLEETPGPQEGDVTRVPISKDVLKKIGVKGRKLKTIIKQTGANARVSYGKQPQILLLGPLEARLKAKEKIMKLQKKKNKRANAVDQSTLSNPDDTHSTLSNPDDTHSTPTKSMHSESNISTRSSGITETAAKNTNKNSWCAEFVTQLDRKLFAVKRVTRSLLMTLSAKEAEDLHDIINKVKLLRSEMILNPSLKPSKKLQKKFYLIAKACLQSEKYTKRRNIHRKIIDLHKFLKKCNSKVVPENVCDAIAKAVEPLYNICDDNYSVVLKHAESVMFDRLNNKEKKKENKKKPNKQTKINSTKCSPTKTKNKTKKNKQVWVKESTR